MNTQPQTARADVVTGTLTGVAASTGTQLTATKARITQGVWVYPSSEQIFWVGIDAAPVNSGARMECSVGDADKGAFNQGCFIPINDPSRVYVHAVGASGVVGFMYC